MTLQGSGLVTLNPFTLPEFAFGIGRPVQPYINRHVISAVPLAGRVGALPVVAVFFRDAKDELDKKILEVCAMEFTAVISVVKKPQVIGIVGRIYDDPKNAFQFESLAAPFIPYDRTRHTYELFTRQKDFDFVVLDPQGIVKHVRRVAMAERMLATNRVLTDMFSKDKGVPLSDAEITAALVQHRSLTNLAKLQF